MDLSLFLFLSITLVLLVAGALLLLARRISGMRDAVDRAWQALEALIGQRHGDVATLVAALEQETAMPAAPKISLATMLQDAISEQGTPVQQATAERRLTLAIEALGSAPRSDTMHAEAQIMRQVSALRGDADRIDQAAQRYNEAAAHAARAVRSGAGAWLASQSGWSAPELFQPRS